MRFHYKRFWIKQSEEKPWIVISRPIVPILISGPSGSARLPALVDTGSDETLLPYSVAETLGIKISNATKAEVMGIGDQPLEVSYGTIELCITGLIEQFKWSTRVGFVKYGDPENESVILGHKGCLEFFQLFFDGPKKELEIKLGATFPGK